MISNKSCNYDRLQDCVDSYLLEGDDQGEKLIADLQHILKEGYVYHYKKALAHLAALESISSFAEKRPNNESNN